MHLLRFVARQAAAATFGIVLLSLILLTRVAWPEHALVPRYDVLFVAAVLTQLALVALRLETPAEARVIAVFHVVATAMELFKTAVGSWAYPEPAFFALGGVPLFAGFMYSAVGSYLARARRLHHVELLDRPPLLVAGGLAALAYLNFFTHHVLVDLRVPLLVAIVVAFRRTRVRANVAGQRVQVPFVVALLGVAVLVWVAENVATLGGAWVYPSQADGWHLVSLHKIPAWFLMGLVSVVLVSTSDPRASRLTSGMVAPEAPPWTPTSSRPTRASSCWAPDPPGCRSPTT